LSKTPFESGVKTGATKGKAVPLPHVVCVVLKVASYAADLHCEDYCSLIENVSGKNISSKCCRRINQGGGGYTVLPLSVCPSVQDIFRRIFLSNCWWQKSDIWSQASYRYTILWVAFLDPSDSYFLFADLVGLYTHWTYMHIFRHIFLSNYWWQRSDIWSQASYRYPISWEAFLNPSDSYFLFDDFVDFSTHWTYMLIFRCIFLSNYWWQKSDIWSRASYRYPILWEAIKIPTSCLPKSGGIIGEH
jgi:hypothetical protein